MMTDNHKGYVGSIEMIWGNPAIWTIPIRGKILNIKDLIIYECTSFDIRETQKQFNLSVDNYIETCEELGKEPQVSWVE